MYASPCTRLLLAGSILLIGPAHDAAALLQVPTAQGLRRHQETAYARGYDDGSRKGTADGRRGARYDPAESREYRDADAGYTESYGSRDAYRTNYRAGFRQGYEDGYRAGTR